MNGSGDCTEGVSGFLMFENEDLNDNLRLACSWLRQEVVFHPMPLYMFTCAVMKQPSLELVEDAYRHVEDSLYVEIADLQDLSSNLPPACEYPVACECHSRFRLEVELCIEASRNILTVVAGLLWPEFYDV